jgi:serine/threonine protein phosphatase 1
MGQMEPKRLLAVGDIHGYAEKLIALLDQVQPSETDRIVFLGDYIDRGPDSKAVIDYLHDLRAIFPQSVFLRGNHEQQLLNMAFSGKVEDVDFFLINGGDASLASYGGLEAIPVEHISFFKETKLWHLENIANQQYLFVHAGVKPNCPLEQQTAQDLLLISEPFLESSKPMGETIVVHGHTPNPNVPTTAPYRIALDSGVYIKGPISKSSSVLGGKLTCCDVLTRKIWQA